MAVGEGDLLDGRYRLEERLAHGGMATVWRAYDEQLGRRVAVKLLDRVRRGGRRARARVRVEAQVLAALTHPYLPEVYDYDATGGSVPYLVMELVDGRSMAQVLAEEGVPPWPVAVSACAHVASALAAAHARGVVHRDVTAANVMLTEDGTRLIDFGISSAEGQRDTDADGGLHGTVAYIAPERLAGQPVAPPADVYSLGVLLYQALSGRLPWPGATAQQVLLAQQLREPDPLPRVAGLPPGVADTCRRCLARDLQHRPSAAEVGRVLRAALSQSADPLPAEPTEEDPEPRMLVTQILPSTTVAAAARRPRVARIAGALAALAAVGVFGWLEPGWAPSGQPVTSQALGGAPARLSSRPVAPPCGVGPDAGACASPAGAAAPPPAVGAAAATAVSRSPGLHKAKGQSRAGRHQRGVSAKSK
jgi:serine/threonine-protein kinase